MRRRRWSSLVVVAVLAFVAAGCIQTVRPPGAAPLRYRDQVFTSHMVTTAVPYGSAVNSQGQTQTLLLDVYRPVGDTVTQRPAIVWVHGGGFSGGTRTSPEIVDQANTFAKKGFVSFSITYRLTPGGCFGNPGDVCFNAIRNAQHDAQAAVRFVRKQASVYGVDPSRIAIAGTSAGAITAENVAYNSEDPGASGNPGYASTVQAAVSLSGAKILGQIDAGEPPSLLFHGTTDGLVPYQWAVNTVNSARAVGVPAYLTTWTGQGHVPYGNRQQILDETTNFLYWTMNLAAAAR